MFEKISYEKKRGQKFCDDFPIFCAEKNFLKSIFSNSFFSVIAYGKKNIFAKIRVRIEIKNSKSRKSVIHFGLGLNE